jgi:5-formyltetrahydrofolate cyclo-ligase
MTKAALRKAYLEKRKALTGPERMRMDDLMLIRFQQLDFSGIETVLSYWPMHHQAEPNTVLFSSYLRHLIPSLQLAYPVTKAENFSMDAVRINEDTEYHENHWGILEPDKGQIIDPQQIDLILVPMLICDKKGYRVGYGKGFYDRFLTRCHQYVVCIGLSYFEPVEEITDTDGFDVPLQYCITPQALYEF